MNTTNHALHVYYIQRNQQAFQKLLEAWRANLSSASAPLSSSAGKSWTRSSSIVGPNSVDVNARDQFGRTVLHLACSNIDPASLEYVKLLLAHPAININLQDTESHWTPLHRALYSGNIPTCILLLRRSEVDTNIKDYDGYTPFDVYNSTIEGTVADPVINPGQRHLFTWGTNRNATLCQSDADDRTYPDQIVLRPQLDDPIQSVVHRFTPVSIKSISMAKFHTVVLTEEFHSNVLLCGFGSSARLGLLSHTQYSLVPLLNFQMHIKQVALGQDHTIALADNGGVYTWGLNRFSQLGYILDNIGKGDEPIQATPRRVQGHLKKQADILGVAACKTASACWTASVLFTWGTNGGQLGYDLTAQRVQTLPRVVTVLEKPVIDVALSDNAMVCLLSTFDVFCFSNNYHTRVVFPTLNAFSELPCSHRSQKPQKLAISKVTTCDGVFACLSVMGDVFTFTVPSVGAFDFKGSVKDRVTQVIKPQMCWAVRKKTSAVRDVALGIDGSIILCTYSGHVYVRSRNTKMVNGKAFKFQQVPYIHRAIEVCANSSGSYGAICSEFPPSLLEVTGNTMAQDLRYLTAWSPYYIRSLSDQRGSINFDEEPDETEVVNQVLMGRTLLSYILAQGTQSPNFRSLTLDPSCGADLIVGPKVNIPAHSIIILARCPGLIAIRKGGILQAGMRSVSYSPTGPSARLNLTGYSPFSILCFLCYIYTDELIAIWDRRVTRRVLYNIDSFTIDPNLVKADLQSLASVMELPALEAALSFVDLRVPETTLESDLKKLFHEMQLPQSPFFELFDVRLHFKDRVFNFHSSILRARTSYFSSFFADEAWTQARRKDVRGIVDIDMHHMRWEAAAIALSHMCYGKEESSLEALARVQTADEAIDLYFEVLSIANELLLGKLSLMCANAILQNVNLFNAGSILSEASFYQVKPMVDSLHQYFAVNLETILEHHLLDDLEASLIKELMQGLRLHQSKKLGAIISENHITHLMEVHSDWLNLQDIPTHILPSNRSIIHRQSPKLAPQETTAIPSERNITTLTPWISPHYPHHSHTEGVFIMEEELGTDITRLITSSSRDTLSLHTVPQAWKVASKHTRNNLRAIMAEAAERGVNEPSTSEIRIDTKPTTAYDQLPGTSRPQIEQSPTTRSTNRSMEIDETLSWRSNLRSNEMQTKPFSKGSPTRKSDQAPRIQEMAAEFPLRHGLGPTFTPVKHTFVKNQSPRKTSNVWGNPVSPSSISSLTAQNSAAFTEIQRQQQQQDAPASPFRVSLRQIQEQEAATQMEEEFLQWWAAEEERVRVEALGELDAQSTSNKRPWKGRKGKEERRVAHKAVIRSIGEGETNAMHREARIKGT